MRMVFAVTAALALLCSGRIVQATTIANASFETNDSWTISVVDPNGECSAYYSTSWASDGSRSFDFQRGTGTMTSPAYAQISQEGVDLTGITGFVFDCQDTGIDTVEPLRFIIDDSVVIGSWTNNGWPNGQGSDWGHTATTTDINIPLQTAFTGIHKLTIQMWETASLYWPADPKYYRIDNLRITGTSSNAPPAIVSLSNTPDPVRAGSDLNLSAIGVSDPDGPDTITNVKFYRESNGTPGLQTGAGGDGLVGTDGSSSDGWTATVATTGLVAGYYTYYAQATDNQGAVSNVVSTISTVETGDMALSFDGGDRAIIPNTAALNPPQITVECWVNFGRIGANPDWQFLVSKGGDRTDGNYRLMQASASVTSNDNFSFGIGPYWNHWAVGTTTPLQANRWYHIAGTYDGQTIRLYVDGALVGSKSVGSIPVGNSSPLYLSYNNVGGFSLLSHRPNGRGSDLELCANARADSVDHERLIDGQRARLGGILGL